MALSIDLLCRAAMQENAVDLFLREDQVPQVRLGGKIMLLGEDLTQDFQLQLDPIGLEEIVAVGQGLTRERRRLGSTVNSISAVTSLPLETSVG